VSSSVSKDRVVVAGAKPAEAQQAKPGVAVLLRPAAGGCWRKFGLRQPRPDCARVANEPCTQPPALRWIKTDAVGTASTMDWQRAGLLANVAGLVRC